ncbi:MAG: cell division protein FtsQ/DivIB [Candidatus Saelkia tenebricola]|nr:cell division protein FtsQ/DivIB [Candidatus Saelkia tenebricola]
MRGILRRFNLEKIQLVTTIFFGLFIVVFLTVFIRYIKNYAFDSPRFVLSDIEIQFDDGKTMISDKAFDYLGLEKGESIFKINPISLRARVLKKHPEILEIDIYKKMPISLKLNVKNRKSVAQIHLGQFYPLDASGFVLPFPSNFRIENLACIEGLSLTEVRIGEDNSTIKIFLGLKILNFLKDAIKDLYSKTNVDVSDSQNTILLLPEGIKVKLGEGGLEEKLARLKLVLEDIKDKKLNPLAIDLRFENAVLIPR